jgi:uncharacterized protein (TIGR03437 family)
VAAASSTVLTAAPGSILSVYGKSLAPFTSNIAGAFAFTGLPASVNGVNVSIGGVKAPLFFLSAQQINLQVPFEVAAGARDLVVTTPKGASARFTLTVTPQAPSIFIQDLAANIGAVIKNSDFSLVTPANPAAAGDILLIYSTGLGQTTPALQTGSLRPRNGFNNTAAVAVTIGGQPATIVYSIASPGFAGLYQTAVATPEGIHGTVPLVLKANAAASNTVNVTVK